VRFCLGEDTFWFVPGWNVGKYYRPNPRSLSYPGSFCARKMHPFRIAGVVEKGRLHQQQVDLVCKLHQVLRWPGVA